jgi:hypothetical protein
MRLMRSKVLLAAGTGNWSLMDFFLPQAVLQMKAGTRARSVET